MGENRLVTALTQRASNETHIGGNAAALRRDGRYQDSPLPRQYRRHQPCIQAAAAIAGAIGSEVREDSERPAPRPMGLNWQLCRLQPPVRSYFASAIH